jgi:hypothetical protein
VTSLFALEFTGLKCRRFDSVNLFKQDFQYALFSSHAKGETVLFCAEKRKSIPVFARFLFRLNEK